MNELEQAFDIIASNFADSSFPKKGSKQWRYAYYEKMKELIASNNSSKNDISDFLGSLKINASSIGDIVKAAQSLIEITKRN